jgi:hypothetical protein
LNLNLKFLPATWKLHTDSLSSIAIAINPSTLLLLLLLLLNYVSKIIISVVFVLHLQNKVNDFSLNSLPPPTPIISSQNSFIPHPNPYSYPLSLTSSHSLPPTTTISLLSLSP